MIDVIDFAGVSCLKFCKNGRERLEIQASSQRNHCLTIEMAFDLDILMSINGRTSTPR